MTLQQDVLVRIAKFAVDTRHGVGAWDKLSADDRSEWTNAAYYSIFKNSEFREPHYEIRRGGVTIASHIGTIELAKKDAESRISDDCQTVTIYEVMEREVTSFYQRVVKTVVETGTEED